MSEPNIAKVLRWLIYGVALVPLIIFSQFISPFHFGKVVIFRSIVELMTVFYLVLVLQDRRYLPRTNKIFWAFLAFVGAFTLTTITSTQPYDSFWGSLERMGGLWTFWHYFVFYSILTSVFTKKEHWLKLLDIVIAVGILSAFYGFLQKTDLTFIVGSGNRTRIFGTIGNAALFAGYQLLILFLSATFFFRPDITKRKKFFYAFVVLIATIAVLMTAVRGSVLALGVGFILFAFLYFRTYGSLAAKKALLGLFVLAILFVGFALAFRESGLVKSSGYLSRMTDFSLTTYTVQTRFWAWEAGITGWKETPKTVLLGWGPENFNIPFSKYFNPKFFRGPGSETLFDRAHNMFIEILVTMGILGLLAYLSIFWAAFKKLFKTLREKSEYSVYALGFIPLVVAYIIHNLFIFDTSANFITFFTILGFISFLGRSTEIDDNQQKYPRKKINSFILVVLFLVSTVLIYKTNVIPSVANYTVTRGIVRGWNSDFNGAVAKFKESLTYNAPGVYEYRHRFAQFLMKQGSSGKLDDNVKDALNYVAVEVEKNKIGRDYDYLPRLYLARINVILGRGDPSSPYNDEALKQALEALEISPTFVRTNYEVAQAYLNKKDSQNASAYFKRAADLNPDVGLSYWYVGVVEIEAGNKEEGLGYVNTAIEKGYSLSENDGLRLIPLLLERNDYTKLAVIYERLIKLNSQNAQYYASLAVAYANIGKIDDAVGAAREAVKIDPSFEAEARAFIRSLGREL